MIGESHDWWKSMKSLILNNKEHHYKKGVETKPKLLDERMVELQSSLEPHSDK